MIVVFSESANGDRVKAHLAKKGTDAPIVGTGDIAPYLARDDVTFILGTFNLTWAKRWLEARGVSPHRIMPYVDDMFAPHFDPAWWHPSVCAEVRDLLADQESKDYFDGVTAFFRTSNIDHLAPNPKRRGQYGYEGIPCPAGVVVDAGAYIGDTFQEFAKASVIYAFEPDAANFAKLKERAGANVVARQIALGARNGRSGLGGEGARAHLSPGDGVQVFTLDSQLKNGPRVDYLKIDVEGADLDVLQGAERVLADRPIVACAAYHKPQHVFEIAAFLKRALEPCRLYASHDPSWQFHIHYIAVPEERGG